MRKAALIFTSAVLAVIAVFPSLLGNTKHAPLPAKILHAKTVYIDNQSGFAGLGDKAYDEVSKWGRFKITNTAKDADVVFLISAQEYVSGYTTHTDSTTQGTVDDSGNVRLNGDSTSRTRAETGGITFLSVVDPKNGNRLWSDQKTWGSGGFRWGGFTFAHSATRSLVKELRKRIEEQESDSKKVAHDADSMKVGGLEATLEANTPEGNAVIAQRCLSLTPDGGMRLMRATGWRMATAYPDAWSQISTELVNSTLKEAGIGTDLHALVGAIADMRAAIATDDSEAIARAVVKILGTPEAEERPKNRAVTALPKRIEEQQSDSKEGDKLDSALEANTPEGDAMVAERYLAMTPDGGVGLMRALAQHMATAYPDAWSRISTELLSSTLKAAGIRTDSQGLFAAIREMRAAIQAKDAEALSRACARL